MVFRQTLLCVLLAVFCVGQSALAQVGEVGQGQGTGQSELSELALLMMGDFATTPDNKEQTIIDRRVPVSVRDEGGVWFYSQLNTGDEQKVYRQRFHQLVTSSDGHSLVQRSYVPIETSRYVDGWAHPEVFAALSLADMRPVLGQGCEQNWVMDPKGIWRGKVDPHSCELFSERRQRTIRIGADSYYRTGVHGTSERGFDEEMNPVWGSKPGEYITLLQCQSTKCEQEARQLSERDQ